MEAKLQRVCYLVEVCVLGGRESKAGLLSLKCQEAGQQTLSYLQVVAVEPGGRLGDVTELVSKLLLHDGVQLRLVTLQGVKLHETDTKNGSASSLDVLKRFIVTTLTCRTRQIISTSFSSATKKHISPFSNGKHASIMSSRL